MNKKVYIEAIDILNDSRNTIRLIDDILMQALREDSLKQVRELHNHLAKVIIEWDKIEKIGRK